VKVDPRVDPHNAETPHLAGFQVVPPVLHTLPSDQLLKTPNIAKSLVKSINIGISDAQLKFK